MGALVYFDITSKTARSHTDTDSNSVGDSEALIRLLDSIGEVEGAFESDRAKRVGLVSGAVLTVQNATQIVLTPVAEIASGVAK